jgi:hypothetical protein
MLGVRRATVTDTLHVLEGEGLIWSRRGVIEVRDRAQLLAFAGESYGAAETEYARFIAPFSNPVIHLHLGRGSSNAWLPGIEFGAEPAAAGKSGPGWGSVQPGPFARSPARNWM